MCCIHTSSGMVLVPTRTRGWRRHAICRISNLTVERHNPKCLVGSLTHSHTIIVNPLASFSFLADESDTPKTHEFYTSLSEDPLDEDDNVWSLFKSLYCDEIGLSRVFRGPSVTAAHLWQLYSGKPCYCWYTHATHNHLATPFSGWVMRVVRWSLRWSQSPTLLVPTWIQKMVSVSKRVLLSWWILAVTTFVVCIQCSLLIPVRQCMSGLAAELAKMRKSRPWAMLMWEILESVQNTMCRQVY